MALMLKKGRPKEDFYAKELSNDCHPQHDAE
jgi:hypothetical protein